MYTIIVRGDAKTDFEDLKELNGISCQEEFTEYFGRDQQALTNKGVKSGYLEFKYSGEKLWAVTTYTSPKKLTDQELEVLKDYTQGQWSDGIGEGFEQQEQYIGDDEVYISAWHSEQELTVTQLKRHPSLEKPETLEDAFAFIELIRENFVEADAKWFDNALEDDERTFMGQIHHGLGTHIRNKFGMWDEKAPLHNWFKERGIWHADDMSGIVLTSYHRLQSGDDIRFDEQVKHYQDYWEKERDSNKPK